MKKRIQVTQRFEARFDMSPQGWRRRLPGLELLWKQTQGDRLITIAVIDGAVDLSHPCFLGADLRVVESVVPSQPVSGHGTAVASILFGRPASGFAGLAPGCRGLIIPVFAAAEKPAVTACSQVDLARAIGLALVNGANVINISGGQLDAGGEASPILAKAIRDCAEQGVLVVAAAGNDGCDCLHVPAAEPSVLAVGAMDEAGAPIETSNWGKVYQSQGLLAPGRGIPVAVPGGGGASLTGTSFATPIVSGIAALLLSLQREQGRPLDIGAVRAALFGTARGCDVEPVGDCRRLLSGRLDVAGAVAQISQADPDTEAPASETATTVQAANDETAETWMAAVTALEIEETIEVVSDLEGVAAAPDSASAVESVMPSDAGGRPEKAAEPAVVVSGGSIRPAFGPTLVYALGQLGYDFGTETRRNWFLQQGMDDSYAPSALLAFLAKNPAHATAVIFTLLQDAIPIYAVVPGGTFAAEAYGLLRELMAAQISARAERIAIPGWTLGATELMNGHSVPLLFPEPRGMSLWSTQELVGKVLGTPLGRGKKKFVGYEEKAIEIANFIERIHDELRNLGLTPPERAMNYAATHAAQLGNVYISAYEDGMALDTIGIERSPICRPESDCWDVKLVFFHPKKRLEQARLVYRFTVDVSDIVPVTMGKIRRWEIY